MKTKPDVPANPYGYDLSNSFESTRGGSLIHNAGLTKLEYFAGQAMQGFCANPELDECDDNYYKAIAASSVQQAKALIAALNESEGDRRE